VPWFFDYYEIRARIAPTIVVLSPLIMAFLFVILTVSGSWISSLGSIVVIALLMAYTLSFLPRQLGRKVEPELWASWDGAPTTRMLRWRDQTLDHETKRQVRMRAEQVSGVTLLSREEEDEHPDEADERISRAFTQVRATMRREDPEGLWTRHNAEYGLNRNLLGSRKLWLGLSVLGGLTCAAFWYFYPSEPLLAVGLILEIASIALAYVLGWHLLPRSVKTAADRYAESILGSLLAGANK
jgi:hypothetical protein